MGLFDTGSRGSCEQLPLQLQEYRMFAARPQLPTDSVTLARTANRFHILRPMKQALIALEDGRAFFGENFGAHGTRVGEICFNTSMTGYQEVLTDPSYRGQIVTMTYPLIGNYGVNRLDEESAQPHVRGF